MTFFTKIKKYIFDENYRWTVNEGHGLHSFLSDKTCIKLLFKKKMGYKLNLYNPQTFSEKLQWLKLYDRNPLYTTLVDKNAVKEYVAGIIGEEYIIPTLGIWEHFDDINFDELPDRFVLKCTHDSGSVTVCADKHTFDKEKAKNKLEKALERNYYYHGREWPYKNVPPKILAEEYLKQEDDSGLTDYKFFCFNGAPKLLYISRGLEHHPTAQISFYDLDGKEMNFYRKDYQRYQNARMPSNFCEMKDLARKLAQSIGSPFVRIDLYSISGRIYFSEITFSPCSGMIPFEPESADQELGKLLAIPSK